MGFGARSSVRESKTNPDIGARATAHIFSKDFVIHVDASKAGARAFLAQHKGESAVIIAKIFHPFNDSKRHYSASFEE